MAFESQPIAIQEMLNGNVDAAIGDNAVVYEYIKAHPDQKLKVIEDDAFEKNTMASWFKKAIKNC